jgi:hypothetical protein
MPPKDLPFSPLDAAAAALSFALELCALVALAYWGSGVHVAVAVVTPLAAAVVWGTFCSPRAAVKLPPAAKQAVQLVVLLGAAAALSAAGRHVLAAIFAALVLVDAGLRRRQATRLPP